MKRTIDLANVIRSLSHELHPGVLQHAGLVAALQGHCAEFGRQHAIGVECARNAFRLKVARGDLFRVQGTLRLW
jgi:signal transduction histidine kinase